MTDTNTTALQQDGDSGRDFILTEGGCWIEVDNVVLYIWRGHNGVHVETFPTEYEEEDGIGELYVPFPVR